MHVRPLQDRLTVKIDPRPEEEMRGGLVLPPGTSVATREWTGTVLRVGPGKWYWNDRLEKMVLVPVGVKPGNKVAFFRENLEHQSGKQLTAIMHDVEEGTILLQERDLLWVED